MNKYDKFTTLKLKKKDFLMKYHTHVKTFEILVNKS